jgi:hypothetical protein
MRAGMTPEEFREAGVYLNAGRRRGWRQRLALLLDTPEATVAAWATRSAGNARPLPGVTAVTVKLLVAMLRAEVAARGDLARAAESLTDQVLALSRRSALFPRPSPAIRVMPPAERAPTLAPSAFTETAAELPVLHRPGPSPDTPRPGPPSPRRGRPASPRAGREPHA